MPNLLDKWRWRSSHKEAPRDDPGYRGSDTNTDLRRVAIGGILGLIWGLALYAAWLFTLYQVILVSGGIARADESLITRVLDLALYPPILGMSLVFGVWLP